ncbi:unnamed protein product, partial [Rotaria magnacalcarata]
MSNTIDIGNCCDLPLYNLTFGLDTTVIDSCPPLNIALRSISMILSNEHLLTNFATHFLPFKEYDGRFPSSVPSYIMEKMKMTFTNANVPTIVLSSEEFLDTPITCAIYGSYKGRQRENDINIIYLNKELIDCSRLSDLPQYIIKYASIILFTILHELGHWTFHHFSCALDHDLATPKGVLMEEAGEAVEFLMFGFKIQHYGPQEPKYMIDDIVTHCNNTYRIVPIGYLSMLFRLNTFEHVEDCKSLTIPIMQLITSPMLTEELSKFNYKRVFDPTDEPMLDSTININCPIAKR